MIATALLAIAVILADSVVLCQVHAISVLQRRVRALERERQP